MVKIFSSPFDMVRYCLVKNEKQLKKLCKKHDISLDLFEPLSQGQARSTLLTRNGFNFCVVRMPPKDGYDKNAMIALLVHECVHIKQFILDEMGENKPSPEFECYLVQEITQNLLNEYCKK